MSESLGETPLPKRADRSYRALPFLLLLGLPILISLIGFLFHGYYLWSQSFLGVIPKPAAITLLAAAFLSLLPLLNIPQNDQPQDKPTIRLNWITSFFSMITLTALFYFFRDRALVYGDGYMILANFSADKPELLNVESYLKSLSLLFQQQTYNLIKLFVNLKPEAGFALINSIGGAFGFLGLLRLCGTISNNRYTQILLLLLALGSGATVLFLGHIEYYTWPMALFLWSLYYSLYYLKNGKGLYLSFTFSLLAVLFHILTLPCLLISLMVLIQKKSKTDPVPEKFTPFRLGLSVTILSLITAITAQLSGLPQWLMLIYPIDSVPYWFLAPERLIDILNHLLLVAPFGVAAIIAFIFTKRKTADQTLSEHSMLGLVALFSFLVFFWVEPKLGMARDFDFTTFYAFPLTLWAVITLLDKEINRALFYRMLPAVIITGLLVLGPSLYEKQDAQRATANLDNILWDSPHHQVDYGNARRAMVWGVTVLDQVDMPELSLKNFKRRLEAKPDDYASWYNLGHIYFNRDQLDSAVFCFNRAVEFNRSNYIYPARLAEAEMKLGRIGAAMKHIEKASQLAPTVYKVQYLAGLIFDQAGKSEIALTHLRAASSLRRQAAEPVARIGLIFIDQKKYDSAYFYLNQSLAKKPMNPPLYSPLIKCNLELGKKSEAEHIFKIYKQLAPEAEDLNQLENLLNSTR